MGAAADPAAIHKLGQDVAKGKKINRGKQKGKGSKVAPADEAKNAHGVWPKALVPPPTASTHSSCETCLPFDQ